MELLDIVNKVNELSKSLDSVYEESESALKEELLKRENHMIEFFKKDEDGHKREYYSGVNLPNKHSFRVFKVFLDEDNFVNVDGLLFDRGMPKSFEVIYMKDLPIKSAYLIVRDIIHYKL